MALDPQSLPQSHPRGNAPVAVRLLCVPVLLAVLGAGLWVLGGVLPVGYATSVLLSAIWFAVVAAAVVVIGRRRPQLRRVLTATFAATALASAFGFYWTSIRDDRVNEIVATGVPASKAPAEPPSPSTPAPAQNVELARGTFSGRAHPGEGTAAIVALASGGSRLTFTGFATDNGPDLRVYLVKGPVDGDDVDDPLDLGRLKGNIGNQQYAIPDGVDATAYTTVVIWCRAFSVNFAQADLRAS